MKYHFSINFPFQEYFKSPFREILLDEDNSYLIEEMLRIRTTPKYRISYENWQRMFYEILFHAKIGLLSNIEEDLLYVSGLYLVLREIWNHLISKLTDGKSDILEKQILLGLLKWWITNQYYSIGQEGNALMKELNKQNIENNWELLSYWKKVDPFYVEQVIPKGKPLNILKEQYEFIEIFDQYQNINKKRKKEEIKYIDRLYRYHYNNYKISKEWIDFLKRIENDENIIKGFKQMRIKRENSSQISILIGVITAVYFDIELFLFYDPVSYSLGIFDKDTIPLQWDNPYLVINFNNIINNIFSEYKLWKLKWSTDKLSNIKNNKEIIEQMFNKFLVLIKDISPDDLSLIAKGKIKNKNRFQEIEKKVAFWKIGFDKHEGNKKNIIFEIKEELKRYRKKLN